jgi:enoyl-CoA hydratase/carnithine racemase
VTEHVHSSDPSWIERRTTEAGSQYAVLTLDHDDLNLFDAAMFDSLADNLAELSDVAPRALLIRAEGKVVSGGVDVHLFHGTSVDQAAHLWRRTFGRIIHPLESLPCPVVFAAHGLTLTAAFEMALASDLILASPRASFGLVERVVGLTPSMGGPQRLAERAGSGRARELVMTGGRYGADTLLEWGVVNAIHDDLEGAALQLITDLADGPTLAHRATKQIVAAACSGGVAAADRVVPEISGALFATADLQQAVATFLDSGPGHATFVGR